MLVDPPFPLPLLVGTLMIHEGQGVQSPLETQARGGRAGRKGGWYSQVVHESAKELK